VRDNIKKKGKKKKKKFKAASSLLLLFLVSLIQRVEGEAYIYTLLKSHFVEDSTSFLKLPW
jgi:hypothetical protein